MARPLPEDPMLRELVLRARSFQLNRRRFLGMGAAGASALALAACAPVSGGGTSEDGKLIRWGNWPGYIDGDDGEGSLAEYDGVPPTIAKFQDASGITVEYLTDIDDNNTFYATIKDQLALGSDVGYDTFCVTDWLVSILIRDGQVQDLDKSLIPNAANLAPALADPGWDPGRKQSLPWQSGFAGLVYNAELVPGGIQSVEDLWKPEFKGRVTVLSEMRDTIGVLMLSQGVDISKDFSADDYYNAIDLLESQIAAGQIGAVKGNSYTNDLINGDALVGIVWSGDVQGILNVEAGDGAFEFVIPDSGGTLWSDNFVIPNGSANPTGVAQLINHYYDPEIAAELAAWVNYITPVEGAREAMESIAPEYVDNQLIFPDDDTLSQVKIFRSLSADEEAEFSAAWQRLQVGA